MDKTECQKMRMFIEDNYALEYMIWEQHVLPLNIADNNWDETDD